MRKRAKRAASIRFAPSASAGSITLAMTANFVGRVTMKVEEDQVEMPRTESDFDRVARSFPNCEQCGEGFNIEAARQCKECGLEPLCPKCIGRLDHAGPDGHLCKESDDEG